MKFLQMLLCGIIIGSAIGCDSPNSQKHKYETLKFNVDETLLGPKITDTTLKIMIAPPKGWEKVDDSLLAQVPDQLKGQLTQEIQVVPRWIFLNESSQAMCIISSLDGVEIAPDETLLKTLETAYRENFPKATIQRTIFMKGTFRVHQLMMIASEFVLIKLICDAPETAVFAVDYHVPRNVYKTELRAIESSIGSINLMVR